MAKPNAFDVLKTMAARDLDIRMSRLGDNLVNVRKTKLGGQVTVGVDSQTCSNIMNFAVGTTLHNAVLMVWNTDQFKKVEAELAEEK